MKWGLSVIRVQKIPFCANDLRLDEGNFCILLGTDGLFLSSFIPFRFPAQSSLFRDCAFQMTWDLLFSLLNHIQSKQQLEYNEELTKP